MKIFKGSAFEHPPWVLLYLVLFAVMFFYDSQVGFPYAAWDWGVPVNEVGFKNIIAGSISYTMNHGLFAFELPVYLVQYFLWICFGEYFVIVLSLGIFSFGYYGYFWFLKSKIGDPHFAAVCSGVITFGPFAASQFIAGHLPFLVSLSAIPWVLLVSQRPSIVRGTLALMALMALVFATPHGFVFILIIILGLYAIKTVTLGQVFKVSTMAVLLMVLSVAIAGGPNVKQTHQDSQLTVDQSAFSVSLINGVIQNPITPVDLLVGLRSSSMFDEYVVPEDGLKRAFSLLYTAAIGCFFLIFLLMNKCRLGLVLVCSVLGLCYFISIAFRVPWLLNYPDIFGVVSHPARLLIPVWVVQSTAAFKLLSRTEFPRPIVLKLMLVATLVAVFSWAPLWASPEEVDENQPLVVVVESDPEYSDLTRHIRPGSTTVIFPNAAFYEVGRDRGMAPWQERYLNVESAQARVNLRFDQVMCSASTQDMLRFVDDVPFRYLLFSTADVRKRYVGGCELLEGTSGRLDLDAAEVLFSKLGFTVLYVSERYLLLEAR